MSARLRIAIASYGSAQFHDLHKILNSLGHDPVAYLVSRSMRQSSAPDVDILNAIQ